LFVIGLAFEPKINQEKIDIKGFLSYVVSMIKTILSSLIDSALCITLVTASLAFVVLALCPWYLPSLFHATNGFAWIYGGMALCLSALSFNILDLRG